MERKLAAIQKQSQQTSRQKMDFSRSGIQKQAKWHERHLQSLCARSVLPPTQSDQHHAVSAASGGLDDELAASQWHMCLTEREADILKESVRVVRQTDNDMKKIIDLSQSLDRSGVRQVPAGCITPSGRLWCIHRGRPVLAVERLALQSLQFPQPAMEQHNYCNGNDESLLCRL